MPSAPGPTASTITVRQALDLLDSQFAGLAAGVAQCRYAFWLGSGISRDRVDDLRGVVMRVLAHLRERVVVSNPACAYRRALEQALECAGLSATERALLDTTQPVAAWPGIATIVGRLVRAYSRLLDVRVDGKSRDYLLWDGVDVPKTFAAGVAEPDCEHLCLAVLALEGVLPDVATANWDGLIEAAVHELTGAVGAALRVCVVPDDLREPRLVTRLLKFHGCAVRAAAAPAQYRKLLIASQSQLTAWPHNPDYTVMRSELISLATTRPTLMIGLSAQDVNIQDIFSDAQARMRWDWPSDPPAHVFAEDALGPDQINILKVVYGDAYDSNGAEVEAASLFRAYAKPALCALAIHIIFAKLSMFARHVSAPHLDEAARAAITPGLLSLRSQASDAAEPDRLAYVRSMLSAWSQAMKLFQEGAAASGAKSVYRSLSQSPVQLIPTDPNITTSGIREMATAVGLIGLGQIAGLWTVAGGDPADAHSGVLRLASATGTVRIFFAANNRAGVHLEINGLVSDNDSDAVVVHSTSPVPRMTRSPRSAPGRVGRAGLRSVSMADILYESTSVAHLSLRFKEEAAL